MVKDGLANKPINPSVAAMRVFALEHLNLPKWSNVVLLAVEQANPLEHQAVIRPVLLWNSLMSF